MRIATYMGKLLYCEVKRASGHLIRNDVGQVVLRFDPFAERAEVVSHHLNLNKLFKFDTVIVEIGDEFSELTYCPDRVCSFEVDYQTEGFADAVFAHVDPVNLPPNNTPQLELDFGE